MSTNWIPLLTTLQKHETITTLKPAEPEAISSKMDKVTIDPRLLASPHPPVIQSFAVDYTAPLSTYPFNPAMRGTQRGDTSNVAQLFFMRRKLSGPKPKGTGLGKDKRERSVAMRLGCGGKWWHFSVHRQRSFFCLPLKNQTYLYHYTKMQNVCKLSAEMCEQTYWGPNVHNDFRIFIMKKCNYFNTNG